MQTRSTFRWDGRYGQVQRPFPVLTILSASIFLERTQEDLVSILVGLGMVKDRGRQVRNRLEDDRAAVGAEVTLARPGQARGHLSNVGEMRGLEARDFLGRKGPGRARSAGRVLSEKAAARSSLDEKNIKNAPRLE